MLAVPCIIGRDGNRDGLPTVLLEAMALGTPCISTEVTGIPEIIRDGSTGLLVRPGDAVGLAAACERLLNEPDLGVTLAQHARQLIESNFDARRTSAELREILDASALAAARPLTVRSTAPTEPVEAV
jgi:glycosyltransferase involved in cell wall biosynthesis